MHKKILLYGATDRNNYGDLLFPIIIEKELHNICDEELAFSSCAISESDLTNIGAKTTKGLKYFYRNTRDSIVIVVGGEVLQANWATLHYFLGTKINYVYNFVEKLLPNYSKKVNKLISLIVLRPKNYYPFVLSKKALKIKKVIYNSVGGSSSVKSYSNRMLSLLAESDYFSIRNKPAYDILHEKVESVKLVPDTAVIMSKYYPKASLKKHLSSALTSGASKYIFVQINKGYLGQDIDTFTSELDKLSEELKCKLVLCPIGIAAGHEDPFALDVLNSRLKCNAILIKEPDIEEIMAHIAYSELYIGTSLHGVITAMSFCVPYLGLRAGKVDEYLNTWGVEGLNSIAKENEVFNRAKSAIVTPASVLNDSKEKQFKLVEDQFLQIKNIINS